MADNVTISGAPVGHNCKMSADGYGSRTEKVFTTAYGFGVIGTTDESAHSQAFYPMGRAMSNFVVTFVFSDEDDRNACADWLNAFGSWTSTRATFLRVSIPSRNFLMYGVPITGMEDGGHVGDITVQMAVTFSAALDPNDPFDSLGQLNSLRSVVQLPTAQSVVGSTFYPSGNQLAGSASIDAGIYGTAAGAVKQVIQSVINGVGTIIKDLGG